MTTPVLDRKVKYKQALRLYREALKLDPARRARIFASYGQRKPQITILPMLLKAAAVLAILWKWKIVPRRPWRGDTNRGSRIRDGCIGGCAGPSRSASATT